MYFNSDSTRKRNEFFTFDFFGEFDPVGVCERARLLVDVVDVQHFTHELDDGLGLVEGSGRHCMRRKGSACVRKYNHYHHHVCDPISVATTVSMSDI